MNIIEKNNEHYTDCDVVMLSSLTETIKNDIVVWDGLKIWDGKGEIPHHNQQLHFLSNDTPTAGDWILSDERNNIIQNGGRPLWKLEQVEKITNEWLFVVGRPHEGLNPNWCKKIVATTDKLLKSEWVYKNNILPQIPQSFKEEFIKLFNSNNPIKKVLVKVEEYFDKVDVDKLVDGVSKVYWFPQTVATEHTYHKNGEVGEMINKGRIDEYSVKSFRVKTNRNNEITILDELSFIKPHNMKKLGFDVTEDKNNGYFKYQNDGTKHYNPDYNPKFPEPKGKVLISVNSIHTTLKKENIPYIQIKQDGGTRTVYNGLCPNESFLIGLTKDMVKLSDVFKILDLHTDDAPISYLKSELNKFLTSKTEWDVEIDESGKIKLL
jgi:hypothetical protein